MGDNEDRGWTNATIIIQTFHFRPDFSNEIMQEGRCRIPTHLPQSRSPDLIALDENLAQLSSFKIHIGENSRALEFNGFLVHFYYFFPFWFNPNVVDGWTGVKFGKVPIHS